MRPSARSLEPLRHRPFRLLFIGRTLSGVGDAMVLVALPFAVLEVGDTGDLGLVMGVQATARVVFLLVGGVWADRLPRQLVMMGADVARLVVQSLVAIAFFVDSIAVWQLAVAGAVFGVASAFFNPASTGLVREVVPDEQLQEANALLGLTRNTLQVIGPAVSGLVVATLGFGVVYAIDAATFAASFVALAAMRLSRTKERAARQSMLTEAWEGVRIVRERRWIVVVLSCDVVFNVAFAAFLVLGPVVIDEHFHGARDWGLVQTVAAVGAVAGGLVVLHFKPSRPLVVAYVLGLVTPIELLFLAPPVALALIAVGAGLLAFEQVLFNTFYDTLLQQHVPVDAISRVDSFGWLISLLALPIAMFAIGPLAERIGVEPTLVGCAALGTAAIVAGVSSRAVRDLRFATAPAVTA